MTDNNTDLDSITYIVYTELKMKMKAWIFRYYSGYNYLKYFLSFEHNLKA